MNYEIAKATIKTARNPENGKPLENNTRLFQRGKSFAVRLHGTDVVTIHPDNSYTLDTGGWRTVTTKDRIHRYSPASVYSDRGTWYCAYGGQSHVFQEGMTLHPDGTVTGAGDLDAAAKEKKLREQVKRYARKFTAELYAGNISKPDGGDCWYCLMRSKDGQTMGELGDNSGHILEHVKEGYFVPSLLIVAAERMGASMAAKNDIMALMTGQRARLFDKSENGFIRDQITAALRRYCLRAVGLSY